VDFALAESQDGFGTGTFNLTLHNNVKQILIRKWTKKRFNFDYRLLSFIIEQSREKNFLWNNCWVMQTPFWDASVTKSSVM
jgi:hypothetical protein